MTSPKRASLIHQLRNPPAGWDRSYGHGMGVIWKVMRLTPAAHLEVGTWTEPQFASMLWVKIYNLASGRPALRIASAPWLAVSEFDTTFDDALTALRQPGSRFGIKWDRCPGCGLNHERPARPPVVLRCGCTWPEPPPDWALKPDNDLLTWEPECPAHGAQPWRVDPLCPPCRAETERTPVP